MKFMRLVWLVWINAGPHQLFPAHIQLSFQIDLDSVLTASQPRLIKHLRLLL